jgi:catechol 2,3-dioxygenase-like lactoylglutathione lyase family enzyme
MEPRVDLITLGVPDLDAARRFYVDGLGWPVTLDVPGEIVFLQVGHSRVLGLFGAEALEADIGAPPPGGAPGAGMTLAQVVDGEDAVVAATERARAAGATVLKTPQKADFGGFHAYVADPFGFRWEIADNPGWRVDGDGRVSIGPVDA